MFLDRDGGGVTLADAEALAASYVDSVERILGMSPQSLHLVDLAVLREWYA
jgi:hypothetical protein